MFLAWLLGAMFLGVSLSGLGFAWWWAAPDRRLGALALIARVGLAALSIFGLLAGMYLLSLGTEHWLGDPLRRWSGAPIVPELWLALELWVRDLAWGAAHARRGGHPLFAGALAVAVALAWAAAKVCMILSAYVALWATLGW